MPISFAEKLRDGSDDVMLGIARNFRINRQGQRFAGSLFRLRQIAAVCSRDIENTPVGAIRADNRSRFRFRACPNVLAIHPDSGCEPHIGDKCDDLLGRVLR